MPYVNTWRSQRTKALEKNKQKGVQNQTVQHQPSRVGKKSIISVDKKLEYQSVDSIYILG